MEDDVNTTVQTSVIRISFPPDYDGELEVYVHKIRNNQGYTFSFHLAKETPDETMKSALSRAGKIFWEALE